MQSFVQNSTPLTRAITTFDELAQAIKAFPKKKVAVAAAQDAAVLTAVNDARQGGIADYILVGDRDKILKLATELNIKLDESAIVHEPNDIEAAGCAVKMVSEGKADILMKGYIHSDDYLRAVLNKDWGLRAGPTMSHVFIWEALRYGRLIFVTDGAMNVAPDLVTQANIIMNAVYLAHVFGVVEPKVALLAAVEMVNPSMPATVNAACLAKMNDRCQYSESFKIDGPLALDNALSPESAAHKKISGPVAGHADILIVPDIESGNMLAKSFVYLTGGDMAGILVGAKAPVVLTSRSDSSRSKLFSIAAAVLMSGAARNLWLKIGKVHY